MAKWTSKDKRQFSHVEESELERGSSEDEAAEIAGRTVNKQRRKEGRTPNKSMQGTGNCLIFTILSNHYDSCDQS